MVSSEKPATNPYKFNKEFTLLLTIIDTALFIGIMLIIIISMRWSDK